MKNKEIEELLNYLKDNNDWYVIENKEEHNIEPYKLLLPTERNLLLSYIEQLEEEIHKKEAMYDSLAVDYRLSQEQNEQLENNRDKAYEFVKEKRKVIEWYDTDLFYLESLLKGGSDENRNV